MVAAVGSGFLVLVAATGAIAGEAMRLTLTSPSFAPNAAIPEKHTCKGSEISPALSWSGVPLGCKSLALIVDDPDAPDPSAPQRTWVHWVVYDIPPDANSIVEGASRSGLPRGALAGRND